MKKKLKLGGVIAIAIVFSLIVVITAMCIRPVNIKTISHRGYSSVAPENTIIAFEKSSERGYKFVECDVEFTKDGVAVLLHDESIKRTSNATEDINVRELTFEEIRKYDFGYPDKFKDEFKGEKIPTFEEFISLCKERDLHPYIELKSQGGNYAYTEENVKSLIDIVEKYNLTVTYISFNYSLLEMVKKFDAFARLGYVKNKITNEVVSQTLALKTGKNEVFLNVNYGYLTNKKVELVKSKGIPLEVWTINEEIIVKFLHPYISGVTTDKLIFN